MDPSAVRVHPHQALAVYVESLAAGADVAVLGDASFGMAARMVHLGARTVHVWDPDRNRALAQAERATAGVRVLPYSPHDLVARNLDLVIVPDLGSFDDPADVIARARAMVGDAGVALIRAANRETAGHESGRAFDYYELFDLVAAAFSNVRMVAELAFEGVALVALSEDDEPPAVTVDTQLADGDRVVSAFVAVAGQGDAHVEAYSIVELPPRGRDQEADATDALRTELSNARLRTEGLESELMHRAARSAELEVALAAETHHVSVLLAHVDEARAAAAAVRGSAQAEIDAITQHAHQTDRRSARLERDLSAAGEACAAELAHFEEALRERAQAIRLLEAEMARRDQIVRDLVSALDESGSYPEPPTGDDPVEGHALLAENARLRERLDALALDLARREGEARASSWSVAELERRLAELTSDNAGVRRESEGASTVLSDASRAESNAALFAALDEIDVLRRALSQEHESRLRAESGDALARARSDIERLTVLLEQSTREPEASEEARPPSPT
ncbi:MAG: hypothetical protein ABSF69_12125 [Polyangiaceae bacterium]|jgi:hypothetical protein